MSYATVQNAIDLYGDEYVTTSVDRDENGKPDYKSFVKASAQASSEIDSYLSTRYDVPFTPVPDVLVRFAVDIAIYVCSSGVGQGLTDEKTNRYERAIKWLEGVAAGKVNIGLPSEELEDDPMPIVAESPARLFTRSKLGGLL